MLIEALPDLTWKLVCYFLLHLAAVAVAAEAAAEAIVENDALEDFKQWVGSKSTTLGLGLMCGKCFSFWMAALAGGFVAYRWWPMLGFFALVFPLGGWRLAALYHDCLSYIAAKKEMLLNTVIPPPTAPGRR